jgi:hypothetical protein
MKLIYFYYCTLLITLNEINEIIDVLRLIDASFRQI